MALRIAGSEARNQEEDNRAEKERTDGDEQRGESKRARETPGQQCARLERGQNGSAARDESRSATKVETASTRKMPSEIRKLVSTVRMAEARMEAKASTAETRNRDCCARNRGARAWQTAADGSRPAMRNKATRSAHLRLISGEDPEIKWEKQEVGEHQPGGHTHGKFPVHAPAIGGCLGIPAQW